MRTIQSQLKFNLFIGNFSGGARNAKHDLLAGFYIALIRACQPDLILGQELAREMAAHHSRRGGMFDFSVDSGGDRDLLGILARRLPEYQFFYTPTIWSNRHDHPAKWKRVNLPEGMVRTQGSAIGYKKGTVEPLGYWSGKTGSEIEPMDVDLPLGENAEAYGGTRVTERRNGNALRFRHGNRELLAWNTHLTTLVGEREGNPKIDAAADKLRQSQLETILKSCRSFGDEASEVPILIGGDFNVDAVRLRNYLEALCGGDKYTAIVRGETRPGNRSATDNLLLDARTRTEYASDVAILMGEKSRRVGSAQANTDSHGELIDRLVLEAGIDHFPILAKLVH